MKLRVELTIYHSFYTPSFSDTGGNDVYTKGMSCAPLGLEYYVIFKLTSLHYETYMQIYSFNNETIYVMYVWYNEGNSAGWYA